MTTHYHLHVEAPARPDELHNHYFLDGPVLVTSSAEEEVRSFEQGYADAVIKRLRRLSAFRALPWYRRAWLTLTGKAPR